MRTPVNPNQMTTDESTDDIPLVKFWVTSAKNENMNSFPETAWTNMGQIDRTFLRLWEQRDKLDENM